MEHVPEPMRYHITFNWNPFELVIWKKHCSVGEYLAPVRPKSIDPLLKSKEQSFFWKLKPWVKRIRCRSWNIFSVWINWQAVSRWSKSADLWKWTIGNANLMRFHSHRKQSRKDRRGFVAGIWCDTRTTSSVCTTMQSIEGFIRIG